MALKKYGKTVQVTVTGGSSYTFTGSNGIAAYNALMNHEQIVAIGAAQGADHPAHMIIPYHAVVYATVINTSEDATIAADNTCWTE